MCTHQLDGGPLVCQRTDDHDQAAAGGHVYAASWAADHHDTTEANDDD